jgi:thiol-activated cytolysin
MNKQVQDYLYGLKRSESDLAYDGRTKLTTTQTVKGNECVLISCEKKAIEQSMDTMLVLSTIKPTIYPGSIILANSSLVDGTPTEVSLPKKEGRITIDATQQSAASKMDSSSVNAAIDKLLRDYFAQGKAMSKAQANFQYAYTEAFSREQVKASLGVDCERIKLSCNFETIASGESKAVIVAFSQIYFTAACDRSANGDVFAESVTVEDLKRAGVRDNNLPCYISAVSYGRCFYVCIQSSDSKLDMKLAAQAMINGVVARTDNELHQELKKCSITCVCLGGDPKSHIRIISGDVDQISAVIKENVELSPTNYGYPISYCCNYLTDNKVATIKSATEYVKITRKVTHGHALSLSSNCGYVYKWNVSWAVRDMDGKGHETTRTCTYRENNSKHTSGWGDTIQIPPNATNIHVRCDDYWWIGSTRCVCDEDIEMHDRINVHITGTTLSPRYKVNYTDSAVPA